MYVKPREEPGETVISLYRFASNAFSPFITEERVPLKSRSLVILYGINAVFQFLHLCICIAAGPPVPGYLSAALVRKGLHEFVMQRRCRFRSRYGSQENCDDVRLPIQN